MNTSLSRPLSGALLYVSLLSISLFAQNLDHTSVSGKVSDTNGDAVRGASVTLSSAEGDIPRRMSTDARGFFRLSGIPPGLYRLRVAAEGFGPVSVSAFMLLSGSSAEFPLTLAPAGVSASQTVEIDAESVMRIDTARTAVTATFGAGEIASIPNLERDPLHLLLLLGGISEEALSVRELADQDSPEFRGTPVEQGNASVSGGTSYSNNMTVDGLDNNDDRTSRSRFAPPIDAVVEVQVVRNQFSAEYGRAAGSRINLVTGSGGRRLRGTLSAWMRHDRMNANSWRANSRGIPRLRDRRHGFSETLSGPLRLPPSLGAWSFLASHETGTTSDDTLIDTFVPESSNPFFAMPRGNTGESVCESDDPSRCVGPDATSALMRRFVDRFATPETARSFLGRIDHRTRRGIDTSLGVQFGRRDNPRSAAARITRLPEAVQTRSSRTVAVNLSSSQSFAGRWFNQARFQYSTLSPAFSSARPGAPVVLVSYRNPLTGSPETLVASNSTSGTLRNFSETRRERRLQLTDSATFAGDRHTLRAGFDLHAVTSRAAALEDASGTYSFPSMNAFGVPTLSRFRQNFGTASEVRNRYAGLFINDEYRVRGNVNVTFGLRYENEVALRDRDNFGPRIGLAWDPGSDGTSVVRVGAGRFFNRILLRTVEDYRRGLSEETARFDTNLIGISASDIRRLRVLAAVAGGFPKGFASAAELRDLISATDCAPAGAPRLPCPSTTGFARTAGSAALPERTISSGIRIPESLQFNAGYERRLGRSLFLEVNATLNRTDGLWREHALNLPILPHGHDDWTSYLLGNPMRFVNTNGTVRTYVFHLGPPVAGGGVSLRADGSGTCPTSANATCHVNLNAVGSTVTYPSTASADTSNSVGSALGIAAAAIAHLRPDPDAGHRETISSAGRSRYRGLVAELRMGRGRMPFGFRGSWRASYTLSSSKDDGLNNTSNAEVDGDFAREWARSLTDRRNRVSLAGSIDAPRALGGFSVSPSFRFGTSAPFNIGLGVDRNLDGSSTDRPLFSGDGRSIEWRRPGSEPAEPLLSKFSLQPIGARGGSLPRNAGKGPSMMMLDVGFSRRFRTHRRMVWAPRIDIGNILNMTVFSFGAEYIDFPVAGPEPTESQRNAMRNFLVPSRTLRPREARGSLRIEF